MSRLRHQLDKDSEGIARARARGGDSSTTRALPSRKRTDELSNNEIKHRGSDRINSEVAGIEVRVLTVRAYNADMIANGSDFAISFPLARKRLVYTRRVSGISGARDSTRIVVVVIIVVARAFKVIAKPR